MLDLLTSFSSKRSTSSRRLAQEAQPTLPSINADEYTSRSKRRLNSNPQAPSDEHGWRLIPSASLADIPYANDSTEVLVGGLTRQGQMAQETRSTRPPTRRQSALPLAPFGTGTFDLEGDLRRMESMPVLASTSPRVAQRTSSRVPPGAQPLNDAGDEEPHYHPAGDAGDHVDYAGYEGPVPKRDSFLLARQRMENQAQRQSECLCQDCRTPPPPRRQRSFFDDVMEDYVAERRRYLEKGGRIDPKSLYARFPDTVTDTAAYTGLATTHNTPPRKGNGATLERRAALRTSHSAISIRSRARQQPQGQDVFGPIIRPSTVYLHLTLHEAAFKEPAPPASPALPNPHHNGLVALPNPHHEQGRREVHDDGDVTVKELHLRRAKAAAALGLPRSKIAPAMRT